MAQPHASEASSSSSSPFSSIRANRDTSGASTSYTSTSQVREEENESNHPQFRSPELESQHLNISYQGGVNWGSIDVSSILRDDTWSCVIVLFVFWLFVSMTMILGVYGSMNLVLGPNSSILVHPSSIFVQSIKVENLNKSMSGAMLYGVYGSPSLDIVSTWTETHNVFMPSNSHKEWIYYLNEGSQVNISYCLNSQSSSIFLVIAEGDEGLTQWLEDPTYPNTTLSWSIIHGSGMISQQIFRSSSYYVAVSNLNEEVEVELNLRVMAFLYNTTNAYYKCDLSSKPCSLSVFFPGENAAVLTSPGPEQNASSDEWHVKVSYGPRWVTYIFGTGVLTLMMFLAFNFLHKLHCIREDRPATEHQGTASQIAPLLSYKDDDLSSWGSSYDSMSQDDEDLNFTGVSIDGKSLGDGETSNNTQRLCAICFDAPRDCFFLPCGHCVACFACGARLVEAAGTCPVCHRNMKKVRKIFTV